MEPTALGKPKTIDGLTSTRNGNNLVLTNPRDGQILVTNHVGGAIIGLADGTRDLDRIVETLALEYPSVEREKLARQVRLFVDDAVRRGLIALQSEDNGAESSNGEVRKSLPVVFSQDLPKEGAGGNGAAEEERKFRPDIYWYLTFRCNLACAHCSVQSSPWVDNSDDLTTEDCLRVIDQMAEMHVSTALLSGGEVLIRPDALTILEALGERDIYIGLETNGLRFDRAFVELALDLQRRNLLGMTISLDGGTKETHETLRGPRSFDRTVRGLRLLKDNGVKFDVQCVLNTNNYTTIPNLYDLAIELSPECEALIWSVLNSAGRGADIMQDLGLDYDKFPEIFDLIHEHKPRYEGINLIKLPPAMVPPKYLMTVYKGKDVGCSTSCKFPLLGVLPNGDITICALSRKEPDMLLGNIRDNTLGEVWQAARLDLLRKRYVSSDHLEGICADCVWKSTCKGSCRAWALKEGDDFYSPYPVCRQAAEMGHFPDEYRISKQGQTLGSAPPGPGAAVSAPPPG